MFKMIIWITYKKLDYQNFDMNMWLWSVFFVPIFHM